MECLLVFLRADHYLLSWIKRNREKSKHGLKPEDSFWRYGDPEAHFFLLAHVDIGDKMSKDERALLIRRFSVHRPFSLPG